MITTFDIFNRVEKPAIILTNPNRVELYPLDGICYETKLSLKFNAVSELSFKYPRSIDNGKTTLAAYEFLRSKRLIFVQNIGYFIIFKADEVVNGGVPVKQVVAYSFESELMNRKITAFSGTYKLYDFSSPSNSLLGKVLALVPSWTIGTIDSDLAAKARSFDINDVTIYNFLVSDIESAFGCVVTFDYFQKKINISKTEKSTTPTDIYLSFDNLLKSGTFTELSDEITTCLHVYGAGDMDIRSVNPIGSDAIYDYSYFCNSDWMSEGLITSYNSWITKVEQNQQAFATLLAKLKTENANLLSLNNELKKEETDYAATETVQKTQIAAGWASAQPGTYEYNQYQATLKKLADIKVLIDKTKSQIALKQKLIDNNVSPLGYKQQLDNIRKSLSFENNFSAALLSELSAFTFENTYQNPNIVQTSIMTPVQIQENSQELYDQAKTILSKVSQPRFEFSVESTNFTVLKEFQKFTSQLVLGAEVTIALREDKHIQTVLLEININFDNPNDFSLTFSNRLRLDNGQYKYTDFWDVIHKAGGTVNFNVPNWDDWKDNYQTEISKFIDSALDASRNAVVNSNNQEILINQAGLRGRTVVDPNAETKTYKPTQVWLTSNTLAFTKDSWNTASLALGEITIGGVKKFGLVADVLVGHMIAGNSLTIESEKKDGDVAVFRVDGSGAKLHNATFDISNTKNKITLDPVNGISIKNVSTGATQFYVDTNGNVNFGGNLVAAKGTFSGALVAATGSFSGQITANSGVLGGFAIKADGIYTPDGQNYLKSNGDMKWGNLTITGGNAVFNGTIRADQIIGQITNTQLAPGVDAGKIDNGTMYGDRISGGTIHGVTLEWPGGEINSKEGYTTVYSDNNITFKVFKTSPLVLAQGYVGVNAVCEIKKDSYFSCFSSAVFSGSTAISGSLSINGSVTVSGNSAYDGDIFVGPSYSNKKIQVNKGIITNVYIM